MSPEAEHVRKLAMQLDPAARWALGRDLLADAPDEQADDDWTPTPEQRAEWRRRSNELDDGTATPIPWKTIRDKWQKRIGDANRG